MHVPLNIPLLFRESCLRLAGLGKELAGNKWLAAAGGVALMGMVHWMDKSGPPGILALSPLLAAGMLLGTILAGMVLPSVRKGARQRWIDEQRSAFLERNSQLFASLSPQGRERYNRMHERVARLADLTPQAQPGPLGPGENLLWLYLKLLIARDHLNDSARLGSMESLEQERLQLLHELDDPALTATGRAARQHSIDLLEQRLTTARMRGGRMDEIEADMVRIEHQLALLCERAAQHSALGDAAVRMNLVTTSAEPLADDLPGGSLINEQEAFLARCAEG